MTAFFVLVEVSNENSNKKSRFDELMGKKQSNEPKKQVPKSLDDFMANISGGKTDAQNATNKKGTVYEYKLG